VEIDGKVYSAEGVSRKEAERWVEQALAKQAELDRRRHELRKRPEDRQGPAAPPPPLPSDSV
jgi:hypothetical protein